MLLYTGMIVLLGLVSGGFFLAVGVVMLLLNIVMAGVFVSFAGSAAREYGENLAKWYGQLSFYITLAVLLMSLIQIAGYLEISEVFWVAMSMYIGTWVSGRLSHFMFDFYLKKLSDTP